MEKSQIIRKNLLTTIFVFILVSIVFLSLIPTVRAIEPNLEAKNMSILNDVIGINTDVYSASEIAQRDIDFLGSPQKEIDTRLT